MMKFTDKGTISTASLRPVNSCFVLANRMEMKAKIERALAPLTGRTLWGYSRAADLASFSFGGKKTVIDINGKRKEIGEYALHIQCAWNISNDSSIVVGSADVYYPPALSNQSPPEDFNWDRGPNRRDELLRQLFVDNNRRFIIEKVVVSLPYVRIPLTKGIALNILPDDSIADHEHWRIFRPNVE